MPDVLLIVPHLQSRRLLLAQLLEDGFDVVPADNWPGPRPWPRPRLAVIDLDGLPNATDALRDLRGLMPADRVIVMTALDGPAERDVRELGFPHVLRRPLSIGEIALEVKRQLSYPHRPT